MIQPLFLKRKLMKTTQMILRLLNNLKYNRHMYKIIPAINKTMRNLMRDLKVTEASHVRMMHGGSLLYVLSGSKKYTQPNPAR